MSRLAAGQAILARQALGGGVFAAFSGRGGGVSAGPYESLNLGLRVGDDAAAALANRAALAAAESLNLGLRVGDDAAAALANRAALAAACGVAAADLAWMHQVHGAEVCYLGAGSAQPPGPVDAIFTDVPGRPLCVQVADCVPVLVADPVSRLVGAAHAGREGLVAGVVPALITAMTAAGASPARMRALTGPSICGGCYEVPAELQERVSATVPEARCQTFDGTAGLDIAAGVRAQLAAAGVGWFRSVPRCTKESDDLYSYRRDGTTGRFAGVIWLTSP